MRILWKERGKYTWNKAKRMWRKDITTLLMSMWVAVCGTVAVFTEAHLWWGKGHYL